jgi:hypothetical protein
MNFVCIENAVRSINRDPRLTRRMLGLLKLADNDAASVTSPATE